MSTELRYDAGNFAYGTWRILDEATQPTPTELAQRLELCLELGIDVLDTAEIYGLYAVEAAIGEAFKASPQLKEKFRVVTKAGIDIPSEEKGVGLNQYNSTSENIVTCAEKSLQLMGIEQLDVFLVHRPDWLAHPEDTAAGLKKLLESGKAKHVGVSNYTIHQFATLDGLMDGALVTNQVEFSPLCMDPMYDGTFDQCLQAKVRPMAWSPLAGGRIFDPSNEAGARLLKKLKELSPNYDDAPVDALIYAWLLANPAKPTIVLGSNKPERIKSGVIGGAIQLSREDWYGIWEAAKGHSIP